MWMRIVLCKIFANLWIQSRSLCSDSGTYRKGVHKHTVYKRHQETEYHREKLWNRTSRACQEERSSRSSRILRILRQSQNSQRNSKQTTQTTQTTLRLAYLVIAAQSRGNDSASTTHCQCPSGPLALTWHSVLRFPWPPMWFIKAS